MQSQASFMLLWMIIISNDLGTWEIILHHYLVREPLILWIDKIFWNDSLLWRRESDFHASRNNLFERETCNITNWCMMWSWRLTFCISSFNQFFPAINCAYTISHRLRSSNSNTFVLFLYFLREFSVDVEILCKVLYILIRDLRFFIII